MDLIMGLEDPRADDVRAILDRHLAFAREVTPPEHVYALDVDAWADPDLALYGARRDGLLIGIGAIRRLNQTHAELKSMHTRAEARGQGVGQAVLSHLLRVARSGGYQRVSLETGTMDAFAAARAMYLKAGFRPCPPFGQYTANPYSVCLTLSLRAGTALGPCCHCVSGGRYSVTILGKRKDYRGRVSAIAGAHACRAEAGCRCPRPGRAYHPAVRRRVAEDHRHEDAPDGRRLHPPALL